MEEKKRELVMKAAEVYLKYGIKSVTMDEMARQLGVSKKTVYQYVKDKNDLVEHCVMLNHQEEEQMIRKIVEQTDNPIEQMLRISRFIIQELQKVHPSIFFDLEKYHPSAKEMIECHKDEFITGCIEQNLIDGIKQNLYRKNLNPKVISAIYVGMIDLVMGSEMMRKTNLRPDEIYTEMFRYHIRGIASEKGLKYLTELLKKDTTLSPGF
ncbi:MAG: TetR/AcrR family transcriptional regulator [Crocinitomicaceae bacterium]